MISVQLENYVLTSLVPSKLSSFNDILSRSINIPKCNLVTSDTSYSLSFQVRAVAQIRCLVIHIDATRTMISNRCLFTQFTLSSHHQDHYPCGDDRTKSVVQNYENGFSKYRKPSDTHLYS